MVKNIAFTLYFVKDLEKFGDFYENELGLKVSNKNDAGIEFEVGGGYFAITNWEADKMEKGDFRGGTIAFAVESVDQLTSTLRKKGIVVKRKPFQSAVCRMSVVIDPDGNDIILHQLLLRL